MKELIPENEDPLNQSAKKALKEVKESPEPSLLYCLQLAEWGLKSGQVKVLQTGLQANLEALMCQWSPKGAMEFLTVNDSGDEENVLAYAEGDESPLNLAVVILNQLDSRLSASLPGYPSPRDLPANFR